MYLIPFLTHPTRFRVGGYYLASEYLNTPKYRASSYMVSPLLGLKVATPENRYVGSKPSSDIYIRESTTNVKKSAIQTYLFRAPLAARRRGCTRFVHGRSRMINYTRIPTMPGRSTSGFHQPGRHCLHQARSAVRCSASRMKGELHPSKNRY